MVLNFKIDKKGTIWLMFCSSFRLDKTNVTDYEPPTTQEVFSIGPKDFPLNEKPPSLNTVKVMIIVV